MSGVEKEDKHTEKLGENSQCRERGKFQSTTITLRESDDMPSMKRRLGCKRDRTIQS